MDSVFTLDGSARRSARGTSARGVQAEGVHGAWLVASALLALVVGSAGRLQAQTGSGELRAAGQVASQTATAFTEADAQRVGQDLAPFAGQEPAVLVDAVIPSGAKGTGTAFPETIQYQLGTSYSSVGRRRPLLVAYHGYGGSAASVATQSTLDEVCNQRGWVYLSVTGLDDKVFGTELSQAHTEAAVNWMLDHFHVDPDQIYMVGFSMGAGVAMNFAARHRDPAGVMIAALGLVSVSADWTSAWLTGSPSVQAVLENPLNFGASPSQDPFGYRRWSGSFHDGSSASMLGSLAPSQSMASNLGSTPVYLSWDTGDATLYVTDQCAQLSNFLPSLGGEVSVKTVFGTLDPATGVPAPHSWAVLKENQLANFFDGKTVDRTPASFRALLADDSTVGNVACEQRVTGAFTSFDTSVLPGAALTQVQNARLLSFDGGGAPADQRVEAIPADGQAFELRVLGLDSRPSYALHESTGALVEDVRSEPWHEALVLPVPAEGLRVNLVSRHDWTARLTVLPDPLPAPGGMTPPATLVAEGFVAVDQAWLVLGMHEALSPVLGGGATLGVQPRPPSILRCLPLEDDGSVVMPLQLPALPVGSGAHAHAQVLFLKTEGTLSAAATSNVWMLRWP